MDFLLVLYTIYLRECRWFYYTVYVCSIFWILFFLGRHVFNGAISELFFLFVFLFLGLMWVILISTLIWFNYRLKKIKYLILVSIHLNETKKHPRLPAFPRHLNWKKNWITLYISHIYKSTQLLQTEGPSYIKT